MRFLLVVIIPILLTFSAQAQQKPGSRPDNPDFKKIDAFKIGYLTDKLHLSSEEAQQFWPIYNRYSRDMNSLFDQKRKNMFANKDNPVNILNDDLDFDDKINDTKRRYSKELLGVIPAKKVLDWLRAEREFREYLIKRAVTKDHH